MKNIFNTLLGLYNNQMRVLVGSNTTTFNLYGLALNKDTNQPQIVVLDEPMKGNIVVSDYSTIQVKGYCSNYDLIKTFNVNNITSFLNFFSGLLEIGMTPEEWKVMSKLIERSS